MARDYIRLLRPPEWVKNVFVFAALVFGHRLRDPASIQKSLAAFVVFSLAASAGYAFNDVLDRERDRHHPVKKKRPVASGAIHPSTAIVVALALAFVAVAICALALPRPFLLCVIAYWVLTGLYSLALKQLMILDVILISTLFVIRALAGAVAIGVHVSPWLLVCTFMLCLFLGFGKRRCELAQLTDADTAANHRPTLRGYSLDLLTHLLSSSGGMAIITFLLYTMDAQTSSGFPRQYLLYTVPLVVYGIYRYAMLIESGKLTGPTDVIISDRPFLATIVLWCLLVGAIVLWGGRIAAWFGHG